jgi:tetratricopeptide (TPR) repeat protein
VIGLGAAVDYLQAIGMDRIEARERELLARATEALDMARRLAETWQHRELWRWAVATQGHVLRDQDRLDAALAAYQLANCWGEDPEGPAFIQLRQGRMTEARWSCETHLALTSYEGGRGIGDAQLLLGLVELKSGRPNEALALLGNAHELYTDSSYSYHQATAQLYRAAAGMALGRGDLVEAGLASYLSYAASEEVLNCNWWLPELIEPLLLNAVRRGIEPAWAQRLLAARFAGQPATAAAPSPRETTELEIARRMQLSLLPELPPVMPDLDIAALVAPASEIGGDFVGYFPHGADPDAAARRQLGVAVGDISGKGLGAALLLSGAVVALNTVAANGAAPTRVADALHAAMLPYTSRSRMTIAFCYSLLAQQEDGWSLRSTGAGAIPPLLRRASGEIVWLETTGFPLGVFGGARYNELETALAPDDMLLMLSDGIVEAMNHRREMFGFDRLARTLADIGPGADAHDVLTTVVEAVRRHCGPIEPQDDMTLVVVRVLAGSAGT